MWESSFDMYIGYKSPGGNQRGHYIDIRAHGTGFVLSIGGSPDPASVTPSPVSIAVPLYYTGRTYRSWRVCNARRI